MNRDRTVQLLEEHFSNLTEVSNNMIRAERRHNGDPVGIFYFDFSELVARDEFDLKQYTQDRIAIDFYEHEGSLQWNFYLYFILERTAFERMRDTRKLAEIEADRTFARKFIREQEFLNAELAQPLATALHSTTLSPDVASRWVTELTRAKLGSIADSSAAYDPLVRDYLSGALNGRKVSTSPQPVAVSNGRFILSLHLDSYREQPEQKSFEMGTVNLFRGVNGAGKTSLLEAIELCICGGNRRQKGQRPPGVKLRVQYKGQSQSSRCPEASLSVYRSRDRAWYGGYYRHGNRLCENFGRFNFFDSDAAFQLSSASESNSIRDAINALLLGESANTIEERMQQFHERFAREEKQLRQLVEIRRDEITKGEQQIEELRAIKDTRSALSQELRTKAKSCRWRKLPSRFKLDDLTIFEEKVDGIAAELAQNIERLSWLPRVSIKSLERESKQLAKSLKTIVRKKTAAKNNSTALEKVKSRTAQVEGELKALRRLLDYHDEPDALSLLGNDAAVKGAKTTVAKLDEAVNILRSVDLKKIGQHPGRLADAVAQQDREISRQRRRVGDLKTQAAHLETQLGTVKTVVQEIKGLGRRFCEISPNSNDCPLCGAQYEQLATRIALFEFNAPMESSLRELTVQVAREETRLAELQKNSDAVTRIEEAAHIVFFSKHLKLRSIKSVAADLGSLSEMLEAERAHLNNLTNKQKRLKIAGFDEEELRKLLDVADEIPTIPELRVTRKKSIQSLLALTTESFNALLYEWRKREGIGEEIEADLRRITRHTLGNSRVADSDVELEKRKLLVDEVLTETAKIQKIVSFPESQDFSSVEKRLDGFAKAIRRIQQALKAIEEKDVLEQRLTSGLADTRKKLAALEPRHGRAKAALSVLGKLLGSDYKAAYFKKIVSDHKQRFSTIFSRIHAPQEFKDVSIETDVLLERHTGVKSTVSEISAGQRAALALSIFLSLNSSVSERAPWLLFDDPVVTVDDLNILSFLDMLRDLVLLGNRQVFFATANTRIGDLFAKKFDFLGSEFREFFLRRQRANLAQESLA